MRIHACAICRTDLHVIDGDLQEPKLPLVPGHQIVGRVAALGAGAQRFRIGDRVGVPWMAWTCRTCEYCASGQENLCDFAQFTGYTRDGGYAEFTIADERFCLNIPDAYDDIDAAPLLCAGAVGFRSLVKAGNAKRLGIYGFGASAHLITQVAVYQGREVYVFTRSEEGRRFARSLGARWAGGSEETAPVQLDAAIIFAPAGALVPIALKAVRKGGVVVCGGIHMSNIPEFPYELLWGERSVCSVANLTIKEAEEFMSIAATAGIRTSSESFPLESANEALARFRNGEVRGAAVLVIGRENESGRRPCG